MTTNHYQEVIKMNALNFLQTIIIIFDFGLKSLFISKTLWANKEHFMNIY